MLASRDAACRAFVRNSQKAELILPPSIEYLEGDLRDALSVSRAVEGSTVVLLFSGLGAPELLEVKVTANVLREMESPPRVVNLSAWGATTSGPGLLRWHGEADAILDELGLSVDHLRPVLFLESLSAILLEAIKSGVLANPFGGACFPVVPAEEVASDIVDSLLGEKPRRPAGGFLPCTMSLLAELLSNLAKRQIVLRDSPCRVAFPEYFRSELHPEIPRAMTSFCYYLSSGEYGRPLLYKREEEPRDEETRAIIARRLEQFLR